MKKISLLVLIVSSLLFACKKENVEPDTQAKSTTTTPVTPPVTGDVMIYVELPFSSIPSEHEYFVINNTTNDTIFRTSDFQISNGHVKLIEPINHIDTDIYSLCVNFNSLTTSGVFFIDLDGEWYATQEAYNWRTLGNQCMTNQIF